MAACCVTFDPTLAALLFPFESSVILVSFAPAGGKESFPSSWLAISGENKAGGLWEGSVGGQTDGQPGWCCYSK